MSLRPWAMNSQVLLALHPLGETARLEELELGDQPLHLWDEALIKYLPWSVGLCYGECSGCIYWLFLTLPLQKTHGDFFMKPGGVSRDKTCESVGSSLKTVVSMVGFPPLC